MFAMSSTIQPRRKQRAVHCRRERSGSADKFARRGCRVLDTNFFPFAILTVAAGLCDSRSMSTAAATASDRAAQPVPTRAWTRASATLNAFACLVALVLNLIGLGKTLARSFRGHVRQPGYGLTRGFFGTSGIPAIGTCLRRSLMHSVALYKALWHQATRGLSERLSGLRRDRTPPEQGDAHARAGAAAQVNAPAKTASPKWTCDLSSLPTEQDAADAARRRRVGAMIPDVRTAANRTSDNAGMFPDKLLVPIGRLGGSLNQFIAEVDRCKAPASRVETPRFEAPPEHHRPNCLSAEDQLRDPAPPQAKSAEWSSPEAGPRAASGNAFERTETAPAIARPVLPRPAREVAATALL